MQTTNVLRHDDPPTSRKKRRTPGSLKLYLAGAQATEAPPLGPAIGQAGIGVHQFCAAFNEATRDRAGELVVALVTPLAWSQFDLELVTPKPAEARPGSEISALFDLQLARAEKDKEFDYQWAPGDISRYRVRPKIVQGAVAGAGEIIRLWMMLEWGQRSIVADADGFFGVAELRHGIHRFGLLFDDVAHALEQL